MKRIVVYAAIILPLVGLAFWLDIWESTTHVAIFGLVAVFLANYLTDYYEQGEKR